jgi:hypothetical protein
VLADEKQDVPSADSDQIPIPIAEPSVGRSDAASSKRFRR